MYEAERWNTDPIYWTPMVTMNDIDVYIGDIVMFMDSPIENAYIKVKKILKCVS